MTGQHESAVREANDAFYRALSNKDIDAMEALWTHEAGVRCIHPGWDLLEGWEKVRESWALIFRNPSRLTVTPTEVAIRQAGSMAWVSCLETINSGDAKTVARTTNLYIETPEGWKMILHHASQISASEGAASDDDEESGGSTVH